MSTSPRWYREPWGGVLLGLLAAVSALVLLHLVNKVALGDRTMFALDGETNLPTWFSSTLFVVAGLLALAHAAVDVRSRWLWVVVGALFVLFSFDDFVGVHETTERESESLSRLVAQPLVVAVLVYALTALGLRQPRRERVLLFLSAGVLVVALCASLVNTYFDPPYPVLVSVSMLEEASEMLVASLIIAALVSATWRRLETPAQTHRDLDVG